jgi:hypothetical protein
MIPSGQTAGSPGISGAILDAVRALAQAAGPKAVTQIMQRVTGQQRQAEGGQPAQIAGQNAPLGNQFGPTGGAPNP